MSNNRALVNEREARTGVEEEEERKKKEKKNN